MPRPAPQTDRLIALFRLLAARPQQGMTVADIARRIEVNRANLYPMIATLVEAGWLVHDPERKVYGLGPALVGLGDAAAAGFPALTAVRPVAEALSEELGLSSAVFTRSEGMVTLAELVWDIRQGAAPIRLGQTFPLRAPFGAGFVAWSGSEAVDEWLTAPAALARDRALLALEGIRRRGYVIEAETRPDQHIAGVIDAIRPRNAGQSDDEGQLLTDEAVQAMMEDLAHRPDSLPAEVEPGRLYRLTTIGAPIFDPRGEVTAFMVMFGFTGLLPGREVDKLGQRIRHVADRVTAQTGGTARSSDRAQGLGG